jgi:hypothetical protein
MIANSYEGFSRNVREQDLLDINSQLSLVSISIVLPCGIMLIRDVVLHDLILLCF